MAKLSVRDLNVSGKRVFMRVDYNVPMEEKDGKMVINDTTRIKETLPTLKLLLGNGARLVLAAHLGRPDGRREPSMSLAPVAAKLSEMLGQPVGFTDTCVGPQAEAAVAALANGQALLLENVRYHAEEENNDPVFAAQLARLADIYVNDAFGTCHNDKDASMVAVPMRMKNNGKPRAVGLLVAKELQIIDGLMGNPKKPVLAVMGGAKVSDKIAVVEALLPAVVAGRVRVVAADVPSGLHPDTGEADAAVLPAHVTVTFGAVKAGLPADARIGRAPHAP